MSTEQYRKDKLGSSWSSPSIGFSFIWEVWMKPIAWWSFLSYPGQSWLTVAGQVGHILLGTRALRLAGRRNGYTVTLRTQHQQGSIYVLLLFSCFIMSHSFVTPWTIACHVPLLMNTCTDRDKHTSGKMPQAAVSNQRRSPFLLQCPQGTFYQQHLMSYWQQRKKKKAQSVMNPPALQENT